MFSGAICTQQTSRPRLGRSCRTPRLAYRIKLRGLLKSARCVVGLSRNQLTWRWEKLEGGRSLLDLLASFVENEKKSDTNKAFPLYPLFDLPVMSLHWTSLHSYKSQNAAKAKPKSPVTGAVSANPTKVRPENTLTQRWERATYRYGCVCLMRAYTYVCWDVNELLHSVRCRFHLPRLNDRWATKPK